VIPGATVAGGRTRFTVWAPKHRHVHLAIDERDGGGRIEMVPRDGGWYELSIEGAREGVRYRYELDDAPRPRVLPDPASRWQPEGVHGPSAVVGATFAWTDAAFRGHALADYVVLELHVGTFTERGTFDAATEHFDDLAELGVTAIEVMPIAQFPGARNWGYDGVFPYAAQESYGGPPGFRRFVDAAHGAGLSVVLDVVYNHLGPDGNVLGAYGPYFTDRYKTPWGTALNFDGADSEPVRGYFVENALMWLDEYHVDALRLDAVHAIVDASAYPFVEQLTDTVHSDVRFADRPRYLIAESAANDARVITPSRARLGLGCDAQWSDDFHHALHALLTGERGGYYVDFGSVGDLATAYSDGWTYSGRYSQFRRARHGRPAVDVPAERFVVFAQDHDQIGNRARGERLSALVGTDSLMVAAAAVLCSPFVPMLFMGEEYGERAPFPYFTSHTDPELAEAVRRGRAAEFADFVGSQQPLDPQDEATFRAAVLDRSQAKAEPHAGLLAWHRALLALRRDVPALASSSFAGLSATADEESRVLVVRREVEDDAVLVVLAFADGEAPVPAVVDAGRDRWRVLLDSHAERADAAPPVVEAASGDDTVTLHRPARSALLLRRRA
jgi:maltooligosyltrehalose trehalohydrolase